MRYEISLKNLDLKNNVATDKGPEKGHEMRRREQNGISNNQKPCWVVLSYNCRMRVLRCVACLSNYR